MLFLKNFSTKLHYRVDISTHTSVAEYNPYFMDKTDAGLQSFAFSFVSMKVQCTSAILKLHYRVDIPFTPQMQKFLTVVY